jgi:hypothetical protein
VRQARTLSEAKGIVNAAREGDRLGFELLDASLSYRGNQGIDLVFRHGQTGRFAIWEAKHGTGLGSLRTYSGLRQGSRAYNESRLNRYLRYGDGQHDALANNLLNGLRNGQVDSYASFYRGRSTYLLPNGWPKNASAIPR